MIWYIVIVTLSPVCARWRDLVLKAAAQIALAELLPYTRACVDSLAKEHHLCAHASACSHDCCARA